MTNAPTSGRGLESLLRNCELPTLPESVQAVMQCVDDPASNADDLAKILSEDPVLAVRTLRVANSPFYGCRYQVDTLQRAVIIIGFEGLRMLTLGTSILDAYSGRAVEALRPRAFRFHCLGTAKAAQMLAEEGYADLSPVQCFTAGLIHDIGKLALAVAYPEDYADLIGQAEKERVSLSRLEEQAFGATHCEIAGALIGRWGFPPLLVDGLRLQECPEMSGVGARRLAMVVGAASELARAAGYGDGGDHHPLRFGDLYLCSQGAAPHDLEIMAVTLSGARADAAALVSALEQRAA